MVTAAKAAVGGAISIAALGTTLPTSADETLAAAFEKLGYASDEGMTRATEMDTEVIKAWGGDVVMILDNGKTETFRFTLIDATSLPALKMIHGSDNVIGTALATGITVQSNNSGKEGHAFVVDMIESEDTLHRIVIPNGVVTEIGDITYVDNDVVGYEVTITAIADSSGNTCYEYMKTAA